MFTYLKEKALGFTFKDMQSGTYRVTITAKHWVKAGGSETLPAGYKNFDIMVAGSGSTGTVSIPASSTEFKSGYVDLVLASGDTQILLNWLNPACAAASGKDGKSKDGKSKDGKSKDGKSKDGKSKDGKSKDGKSKDGKSKDGKSKDGKSKDGKSKDGKHAVCHAANNKTLYVGSTSAVQAHLNHGDTTGPCKVCANLQIRSIKIERIGDGSSLTAYLLKAGVGPGTFFVSLMILLIGLLGVFTISRLKKAEHA